MSFPQVTLIVRSLARRTSVFAIRKKNRFHHLVSGQADSGPLGFFSQKANQLGPKSALKVGDSSDDTDKRV
jgi:hypothetical protein